MCIRDRVMAWSKGQHGARPASVCPSSWPWATATPGLRRPARVVAGVGLATVVLGYHRASDLAAGWLLGRPVVLPALRALQPSPVSAARPHRRARVLPRPRPPPGPTARPGAGGRTPLGGRGVLPDRQGTRRPG